MLLRLLPIVLLAAYAAAQAQPSLTLRGTVKGAQNNTYIEAPFTVPVHTHRLTITFHYTGKEEKTTFDLGVEDPHGFRGWSGGNKSTFTISADDATPSYLPGELIAGQWKLLIGVPNIRPQSTASYAAEVFFEPLDSVKTDAFTDTPLRQGPGWYRGDLHMHTAHSDGHCKSQSGKQVPCPVFLTLEAATRRGLDFIAVTDHNTTSHYDALRELQPYFDQLLLIPGREITTFVGHANIFGITQFVDFREGSTSMNALFEEANHLGALISINHPGAPTGEICMGCGWQAPTDMRLVNTIEAVNGGSEEGSYSGIPFWEKQLNSGYRIPAIGGSDNHDAQLPPDRLGSIGSPTTVVYANDLSVASILSGMRSGRVFVDLTGSKDRLLDFTARGSGTETVMGGTMHSRSGEVLDLSAHVIACSGSKLRIVVDGKEYPAIPDATISSADQTLTAKWTSDGKRHWLRADVVSDSGKLELLGNPIYVNFHE
ncbi:MAG TPA: CehA/McbA family metallohydrolase [Terriglobales bacterium]|nr:CehA/McbA family metallohydrolase [Terriglobales bacterium]